MEVTWLIFTQENWFKFQQFYSNYSLETKADIIIP